jgi:hypothetical protein
MVRAKYSALAALIALALPCVAVAQGIAEPQANKTAADQTAGDDFQGSGCLIDDGCPHWVATADALFLQRSAANHQRLLSDASTGAEVLDASNLNFSMNAGERLSLCREDPAGLGLEVTYFGIDSWHSSANYSSSAFTYGVGDLAIDDTLAVPVTAAQFQYTSRLYSGEINLRYAMNDWLTSLAGLRWVEFEDRYAASGAVPLSSVPFSDLVRGHNHLYGSQIGFDARLLGRENLFRIDLLTKAGMYFNAAAQNNDFVDSSTGFSASASNTHFAFLGEVGVTGSLQVSKHVALRGGYQVLCLTDVALAPNQIRTTDFGSGQASVDTSGTLFCHGANAGLEVVW